MPWADTICPGGQYTAKIDGVTVRPDGVHVGSRDGSLVITSKLIPLFDRLAREAREDREDRQPVSGG